MKNFANYLKMAMAQANMTQAALSDASGCSKAAISQYLSGKNTPAPAKIKALADALGTSVEYLMGFEVSTSDMNNLPQKITPEIAAKCMGVGRDYVRTGLKNGTLDLGSAVLFPSGKWRYEIQPHKLKAHVGAERFNEFFGLTA